VTVVNPPVGCQLLSDRCMATFPAAKHRWFFSNCEIILLDYNRGNDVSQLGQSHCMKVEWLWVKIVTCQL